MSLFRRWWWKPWNWTSQTWLIVIVVGGLFAPFISRWICLWQIPDVVLPFDVEDVIQDDHAPEDDAFVKYARVLASLRRHPIGNYTVSFWVEEDQRSVDWEKRFNQWLIDRRDILAEYQAAGSMTHANSVSLRTATIQTDLSFYQDLRRLVDFAKSEAQLFEQQGDLDQAWACHLAAVRSANHVDKPGVSICSQMGNAIRSVAFDGIVKWSSDPSLTADRLKAARRDLAESLADRLPASASAKADYLILRNTLREFDLSNALSVQQFVTAPLPLVYRSFLWCIGEPELVLRLERQFLANTVSEMDKPRSARRPLVHSDRRLFEDDPKGRRATGQMSSTALARADQGTLFRSRFRVLSSAGRQIDNGCLRSQTRQEMVLVLLAAQEFQRVHGVIPDTLEQLVPAFLEEVPLDPMDPTGSVIRFRHESAGGAIIWSVGDNAIDDDGRIDGKSSLDIGYRVEVGLREVTSE